MIIVKVMKVMIVLVIVINSNSNSNSISISKKRNSISECTWTGGGLLTQDLKKMISLAE